MESDSNTQKSKEGSIPTEETFSLNNNNSTILPPKRVVDMNALLDFIRKNQPVSCWKISKTLNIPNSSLYYKLRDLEFAGVIYSKIHINSSNRTERLIFSKEEKSE